MPSPMQVGLQSVVFPARIPLYLWRSTAQTAANRLPCHSTASRLLPARLAVEGIEPLHQALLRPGVPPGISLRHKVQLSAKFLAH